MAEPDYEHDLDVITDILCEVATVVDEQWGTRHTGILRGDSAHHLAKEIVEYLKQRDNELSAPPVLPIHRTEAGYPRCSTCDGGACYDCTDPA